MTALDLAVPLGVDRDVLAAHAPARRPAPLADAGREAAIFDAVRLSGELLEMRAGQLVVVLVEDDGPVVHVPELVDEIQSHRVGRDRALRVGHHDVALGVGELRRPVHPYRVGGEHHVPARHLHGAVRRDHVRGLVVGDGGGVDGDLAVRRRELAESEAAVGGTDTRGGVRHDGGDQREQDELTEVARHPWAASRMAARSRSASAAHAGSIAARRSPTRKSEPVARTTSPGPQAASRSS